jgi:Phage integrase, N-terminal SAM-like domain
MPTRSDESPVLQEFAASLGARDPKTVTTYLTTVRDFVGWLAIQPGGTAFHLGLVTETAVRGYMDFLATTNRALRTRSKALSALRRFCQWAVDEGHLRRNPARAMERPTVVAVAPTELSDKQRFVLKVTLAQYSVGLQDDRKHVQKVSNPRLVETPFRSPQLALFDLGPDEWLLYWRAPDYTPARRKRRVEGLVQPLLFDFPREEKAVGANKIGPASSPRSYLHVIPSPSDDN